MTAINTSSIMILPNFYSPSIFSWGTVSKCWTTPLSRVIFYLALNWIWYPVSLIELHTLLIGLLCRLMTYIRCVLLVVLCSYHVARKALGACRAHWGCAVEFQCVLTINLVACDSATFVELYISHFLISLVKLSFWYQANFLSYFHNFHPWKSNSVILIIIHWKLLLMLLIVWPFIGSPNQRLIKPFDFFSLFALINGSSI